MKWLKLFTEARTDGKLRILTPQQHLVWFNLLCLAADQSERGTISYQLLRVLAVDVARDDVDLLRETLDLLEEIKIIERSADGDTFKIRFVRFADRQKSKPSDAPERVTERSRKLRERRRNATQRQGNTPATPMQRVATPLEEIKREIKKEEKNPPAPLSSSTPNPELHDEPFNAPGVPIRDPIPAMSPTRIKNDPAEVKRIAAKAEHMFPTCDFGPLVEQFSGDFRMADMEYALDEAKRKRKSAWPYIAAILKNRANSPPEPAGRAEPASEWTDYKTPTEADLERVHFQREVMLRKAEALRLKEEAERAAGRPVGPQLFRPRPMERRA